MKSYSVHCIKILFSISCKKCLKKLGHSVKIHGSCPNSAAILQDCRTVYHGYKRNLAPSTTQTAALSRLGIVGPFFCMITLLFFLTSALLSHGSPFLCLESLSQASFSFCHPNKLAKISVRHVVLYCIHYAFVLSLASYSMVPNCRNPTAIYFGFKNPSKWALFRTQSPNFFKFSIFSVQNFVRNVMQDSFMNRIVRLGSIIRQIY